ncbi:MAG: TraB/GumN family protein [Proteobacteria bacterium]|nr:TraB/GumN family protein [Pseudomonadota bacterium]
MISQGFTPSFNIFTSKPNVHAVPFSKIALPLCYEVTRDNKTHYILGVIHPSSLDALPSYLHNIIASCDTLLTEGMAYIPMDIQEKLIKGHHATPLEYSLFFNKIDNKKQFFSDMQSLLDMYGIKQRLENISPILLYQLFGAYLSQRLNLNDLRTEEKLVSLFKQNGKQVAELNAENNRNDLDNLVAIDSQLDFNGNYALESKQLIESLAEKVNEYYKNPMAFLNSEHVYNVCNHFYNGNYEKMPKLEQEEMDLNPKWADIFEKAHMQNNGSLFLPCGIGHLLEKDGSLLSMLSAKGFSVNAVQYRKSSLSLSGA